MNSSNESIVIMIGGISFVTLAVISYFLKIRKKQVDDCLQERSSSTSKTVLDEISSSNQSQLKIGNREEHSSIETQKASNAGSETLIEGFPENPHQIDNDYPSFLDDFECQIFHNYSDYLGDWISYIGDAQYHVILPFFAGAVFYKQAMVSIQPYLSLRGGETYIGNHLARVVIAQSLMAGALLYTAANNYQTNHISFNITKTNEGCQFTLSSLPPSSSSNQILLNNHLRKTILTNPRLSFLENRILANMRDGKVDGQIKNLLKIKRYVKVHNLSEKSLSDVYMHVLGFHNGIHFSHVENILADNIKKMLFWPLNGYTNDHSFHSVTETKKSE